MTDAATEEMIRLDERERVAALLEDHAELLSEYTVDAEAAIRLVAALLRLHP